MNDLEHARSLLAMAQKDLKALRGMLDPDAFDDEVFGFHAQQAVEKGLKAWIAGIGQRYPKTHDIEELIHILESNSQTIGENALALVELYPFAVQYRYETVDSEDEPLDRSPILETVHSLLERVAKLLSEIE